MRPIVFIGPTISTEEVARQLEAECRPPAAQGDVYLAALTKPPAIGIIDGYFSGKAAVWHKEILWALSQHIPVFGASSMGALRAAELDTFGMVGIGKVYVSYAAGHTEDDDDVAVVHAPVELGSAPLSEPMVNIRATLAGAVEAGVMSATEAETLQLQAKSLNYVNRTWDRIASGLSGTAQTWLSQNRVDQKKLDAQEMLRAIAVVLDGGAPPPPVEFTFERTAIWERATRSWSRVELDGNEQRVLEEAHVSGNAGELRRKALLRKLALADAYERDSEIMPDAQRDALRGFRQRHGLLSASALETWLQDNGLTQEGFNELLLDELFVEDTSAEHASMLDQHMLDVLRLEGRFSALAERATEKRKALAGQGAGAPLASKTGLMKRELLTWFFEHRNGVSIPADLNAYCVSHGIASADRLTEIIAAEYLYLQSDPENT